MDSHALNFLAPATSRYEVQGHTIPFVISVSESEVLANRNCHFHENLAEFCTLLTLFTINP